MALLPWSLLAAPLPHAWAELLEPAGATRFAKESLLIEPGLVPNLAPPALATSVDSLQALLWNDLADDRLEDFTLVEAALIAGGVDDRTALARYNRQLGDWLTELRESKASAPRERAQAVLDFMHRRILSAGFREESTNLAGALDDGRFNCVSSTILFLTLARGCGLNVEAVAEPAHVFCRLVLEDRGALDVQTTDPRAFESDRPMLAGSTASPRPLTERGILALVYYNAGVERLARREFPEALAANERAVRLDPAHREARSNLLAAYNNWAVESVRQGRFRQAVGLIQAARGQAPEHAHLTANLRSVYQQWAAEHFQAGRYREALAVLDESLDALPADDVLLEARHAVERRWMKTRKPAE